MTTNNQLYEWSKKYAGKHLSALKSIKAYCKSQCCCEDNNSWKNCTFTACLLYQYRMGKGIRFQRKKHNSIQHNSVKEQHSDRQEKLI